MRETVFRQVLASLRLHLRLQILQRLFLRLLSHPILLQRSDSYNLAAAVFDIPYFRNQLRLHRREVLQRYLVLLIEFLEHSFDGYLRDFILTMLDQKLLLDVVHYLNFAPA